MVIFVMHCTYIKAFGHNATFWEKKVIFKETGSYPKRFFGQRFFGRIGPCWGGGGNAGRYCAWGGPSAEEWNWNDALGEVKEAMLKEGVEP
jgi:hypothetical protein